MITIETDPIIISLKFPFERLPVDIVPPEGQAKPVKLAFKSGGVMLRAILGGKNYRKAIQKGSTGSVATIKGILGPKGEILNPGLSVMPGKSVTS